MLNTFRKHNKVILAVLGVLLMLGWLVFPALDDLLFQGNRTAQNDPVAVTWKGGRLTRGELYHLRMVHSSTLRFIGMVMQRTQELGGTPKAPGYFFLNPQQGVVGINPSTNEGSLLETIILAQRAKELGVKISDDTVKNFLLDNIGDHTLKEGDLADLLKRSVPEGGSSSVTQGAIFEHLKTELLAQQMRLMVNAGLDSMSPGDITPAGMPVRLMFGGDRGALPPGEMWQVYEKLNRRVNIEAYPIQVSDYVDKVSDKPTDAELRDLYEKGRSRLPSPMESEPAFRQPFRAAFEYVNLELAPFLEEAKKTITDEQIAAEYEKGKAAGRFKVEEPPAEKPAEKPADPADKPADPADKPADDKPAPDKPADDKKPAEGDKPADNKNPTEKPADDKPASEKPAEAKPAEPKPAEAKPDDGKPAEPKKNEGSRRMNGAPASVQFVAFQDEEKKKEEDKPAETKPADVKPADAPKQESPQPETKPADPANPEAKPAEGTKPGDTKPAETKPGETKPGEESKPAETKEAKFKPLDEVKDEIRTSLARPIAADKRTEVVNKIIAAVNDYGRKYNRWKVYEERAEQVAKSGGKEKGRSVEKPAPLNLAEIVGDPNLKLQSVPLVDPFEIADQVDDPQPDGTVKKKPKYPIASSFRFDGQQFAQFGEFAFEPNAGLYFADTLPFPRSVGSTFMGGGGENLWIYWRTDEQKSRERTFEEAKKDVEAYWKRTKALKLAEAAARELAAKVAKGTELKTVVPNAKDVVTPPAFSWLTSGSVGGQFARPLPSQVEGIRFVGEDFREAVFAMDVGESGIAVDEPRTTVWVVRLVGQEGDLSRERFLEKVHDQEFQIAAWQSQLPLQNDIYEQMFEKYNIKWVPNVLEGDEE